MDRSIRQLIWLPKKEGSCHHRVIDTGGLWRHFLPELQFRPLNQETKRVFYGFIVVGTGPSRSRIALDKQNSVRSYQHRRDEQQITTGALDVSTKKEKGLAAESKIWGSNSR